MKIRDFASARTKYDDKREPSHVAEARTGALNLGENSNDDDDDDAHVNQSRFSGTTATCRIRESRLCTEPHE